MKSSNLIRCAAVLIATLGCGTALAAGPAAPSKTVSHADLNLDSSAGVAALYQRIERAAVEVCQLPRGTQLLKIETEIKSCRAGAVDRAVLQANLPALSALHVARTGRKVDNAQYADRR
jgi:UrcA family protein